MKALKNGFKLGIIFSLICIPLMSVVITPKGTTHPSTENKQIVQLFFDAFLANNWNDMKEVLNTNYEIVNADPLHPAAIEKFPEMGKDLQRKMAAFHKALPNFSLRIEDLVSEDNKVFVQVALTGIQSGTFLGIDPTKKTIRMRFFSIFIIEGNKITHITEIWNVYNVMRQLGYIIL